MDRCQQHDNFATCIASLDSHLWPRSMASLVTRGLSCSLSSGVEKNGLRPPRASVADLLRSATTPRARSLLWRSARLSRLLHPARPVSVVLCCEDRAVGLAGQQSVLHQTLCLLRGMRPAHSGSSWPSGFLPRQTQCTRVGELGSFVRTPPLFYRQSPPQPRLQAHFGPPELPCQFRCDRQTTRKMAKPCDLPLGELPAANLDPFHYCLSSQHTIEVSEDLLIANRLARFPAQGSAESRRAAASSIRPLSNISSTRRWIFS